MPKFAISSMMVPPSGSLPTTITSPDQRDWYIRELKPLVTSESDLKNTTKDYSTGQPCDKEVGNNKTYYHLLLVLWQLNEPSTNPDSPSDQSKVI
jgi:hypothetical protein